MCGRPDMCQSSEINVRRASDLSLLFLVIREIVPSGSHSDHCIHSVYFSFSIPLVVIDLAIPAMEPPMQPHDKER